MRERTPASRPIIERLTRFRLSLRNTSTAAALTAAALVQAAAKERAASSANSSGNWKCEPCPESG
jgi:hypothetical protein